MLITLSEILIIHNIKEPSIHLIKLSRFVKPAKDHQGKFCLADYINDFLIYNNDRRHNTTQMRPFKLMTRWMIKIYQKSKGKYNSI